VGGCPLARTINYGYDDLYRLTQASYTSGESYQYTYDPAGNRLQQIINGDTTTYFYDAANRLTSMDGVGYTYDDNGNLLTTGALTNTWDAANRLIETTRAGTTPQPSYDGLGNRVGQTVGLSTTTFALDGHGLPEVIYTSAGHAYLHLPGVIVAEEAAGERYYLLPRALGSSRQLTDASAQVTLARSSEPFGNLVEQARMGLFK
jgi:YD repeat-containing protein